MSSLPTAALVLRHPNAGSRPGVTPSRSPASVGTNAMKITVEGFVSTLRKSRLLEADQMATVYELALAADGHAGALAKRLVRAGLLTMWQARQLAAGRHVFHLGKYKLLEKIGQGHFGSVFRAEQADLKRIVAIKVLSTSALADPNGVARFEREVRLAAQLQHPHIVAAIDAESASGIHFLVMEYVPGRTLRAWVDETGPLPVDWACECVRQAALALVYAHGLGMVHRDIKPSNLMVTAKDVQSAPFVKLLDLGLARIINDEHEQHRLTKAGAVFGTADYIAPEQVESTRDADIRADVYSLGATLFKAITGQAPFPGEGMQEKLLARINGDAPRAGGVRSDLPPELDGVIAKLLARNPEDRYQTPSDVVQALTPFALVVAPVVVHTSSKPKKAKPPKAPKQSPQERIEELERLVTAMHDRLVAVEEALQMATAARRTA